MDTIGSSAPAAAGGSPGRLVPLPRRAPGPDELLRAGAASPPDAVAYLLERTDHLLGQLQADTAHRRRDRGCRRVYEMLGTAMVLRARDDLPDVERVVDVDDPATWWAADSARGLATPLGRVGGRDLALLWLDGGAHGRAVMGGEPGPGVSSLLRTAVAGWSMLYGPDQVELLLVDLPSRVSATPFASWAGRCRPPWRAGPIGTASPPPCSPRSTAGSIAGSRQRRRCWSW